MKYRKKYLVFFLLIGTSLLPLGGVFKVSSTSIIKNNLTVSSSPRSTVGSDGYSDCLMCHSNPDFKGTFGDGTMTSLYVNGGQYEISVHGENGLECVACHITISQYPHHEQEQLGCVDCHDETGGEHLPIDYVTARVYLAYQSSREMSLDINNACRTCHELEFEVATDSAHHRVLESGNINAPVCIDCHGSHDTKPPGEPRANISQTCAACHGAVYSSYETSVHGTALEEQDNPDTPTCIDCHGVHNVRGPRDAAFRNDSINICGNCHADNEMMSRYGISTDVFQTYIDDFHGRTVDLFRKQADDVSSNKAVCYDCHGIHNIRRPEDSLSKVYPTNLQKTCQQCHQEANIRFPQAWLSHYIPSLEQTPLLYVINLVYPALIIFTVGSFTVYIGLDAGKRWSEKRKALRQALAESGNEEDEYDFTKGV